MSGDMPRVALVGLGNMGRAIAEQVLEGGYALTVFNRTAGRETELVERGAAWGGTDATALADADVCLSSLAHDEALEAWALGPEGLLARGRPGTLLIDMSTVSVAASRRVAEAADRATVRYLRAPLSGNPGAVRARTAAIIVSGAEETAREVEGLLGAIASTVRYVGDGESARVLKLVLQIFIGGTAGLLAEAVVLGEAGGVDRATLLDVVNASVAGSPFVKYKSPPLLRDDFSATFTTALMEKDVDLVLDLARDVGVELPLTTEVRSWLEASTRSGHGDEDFMALVLELQERTNAALTQKER